MPSSPRSSTPGKDSAIISGLAILHQCAKIILVDWNEKFPSAVDELMKLPGIGRYTAGAIASFAFDLPAPIVDANIERAVSRLLNLQEPVDQPRGSRVIWDFASRYVQGHHPGLLNSALMELGATICVPRKPLCVICPVRSFCAAIEPESLPRKRERQKIEKKTEFHILALKDDRILLQQNLGKRWHGLWSLPALVPNQQSGQRVDLHRPFLSFNYPITRFVVRLNVFLSEPPPTLSPEQAWHGLELLDSIPMPSPHRRAIRAERSAFGDQRLVFARREHRAGHGGDWGWWRKFSTRHHRPGWENRAHGEITEGQRSPVNTASTLQHSRHSNPPPNAPT